MFMIKKCRLTTVALYSRNLLSEPPSMPIKCYKINQNIACKENAKKTNREFNEIAKNISGILNSSRN